MRYLRWDNSARHSIWNVDHKRLEWPIELFDDGRAVCTFRRGALMAGTISTEEALVLMGTYTRRSYQSAPTERGVRIYIPIDSPRLQAPNTERPVVVADQHRPRLRLGPCVYGFIEEAAEGDAFKSYNSDYENTAEYIDPITLEEIKQPFQIQGHHLNLSGSERGLDYARFLSGIRRVPSRRHDRNTHRWMRELGLVRVGDTYCQEHNGIIVKVFDSNPLLEDQSWSPGVLTDKVDDVIFAYARGSMYAIRNKEGNTSLISLQRRVAEHDFRSDECRQQLLADGGNT